MIRCTIFCILCALQLKQKEMITVAKIRNSSQDNVYGGGKEQIFTDNSGKEYIVKNSSLDNV